MKLFKKYWDIIIGTICGISISLMAHLKTEKIQLYYSIIILMLVCIGFLRAIKNEFEKRKDKRQSAIDTVVNMQPSSKAISLTQAPTKEGENLGKFIFNIFGGNTMEKFKTFFGKFKGYMLTIALGILTAIEMCGGYINAALGDKLVINGIEVIPVITLGAAVVVGILSNGFTKEQRERIKALFSNSNTNELVIAEIRKTIKEDEAKLKEFNKILINQNNELATLEQQLQNAHNTHEAKKQMLHMVPALATPEDVQLAANEVVNLEAKIVDKKVEIDKTQKSIDNLNTMLTALRTQLKEVKQ